MSSLRDRIELLEHDLKAVPPRISVYHDLPFAILRYDPTEEWDLRPEARLLATRLETTGKTVHTIPMSEFLWKAIDGTEGLDEVVGLERSRGYPAAQEQVMTYLSDRDWMPRARLLEERLRKLDPAKDIAFLTRVAAMAPAIYYMSKLLDQMQGRTRVTTILFYPGSIEGTTGLRFMDLKDRDALGKKETLAAFLLRQRFELSVGSRPSLGEVLEALTCTELGFPEATKLADIKLGVLSRMVRSEKPLDDGTLRKTLPRVLLDAKSGGVRGLRAVLLAGWVDSAELPTPSHMPAEEKPRDYPALVEFDLPTFSQTVKAAARACPTGRFGDNKVFISHLWRYLRDEPGFPAMGLPTFKQRLTEANNRQRLTLSRADLVQLMDSVDVQESQTPYLNGEFHFVLTERE